MRVIIASQFGWSAVAREPMTFRQFQFARQVLGELHVGAPRRESDRYKEARERDAMKRARKR